MVNNDSHIQGATVEPYSGFGSKIEGTESCLKINKVLNIALSTLGILSLAIASAAAGLTVALTVTITPIVPIAIAVGSFAVLVGTAVIIRTIYDRCVNHRKRYLLDDETTQANEANAPKLGEFCKADLKVLNSVDQSFEQKKELIRSATQSIECSFNFAGGEKLREFLNIIDERITLHPGLKVHLMISEDLLLKEDRSLLEEYSQKWGSNFNYLITNRQLIFTPFIRTEENHVKLLVVDGRYFGVGGSGVNENMTRENPPETPENTKKSFADKFIDRSFRDTDLFGKAAPEDEQNLAKTMRGQFFNLYQIWAKRMKARLKDDEGVMFNVNPALASCLSFDSDEDVVQNQNINFVVSGPEHRGVNPIESELSKLVDDAEENVNVGNLMFNPSKPICKAFEKVRKNKPEVKLVGHFNGKGPNSSSIHYVHVWPSRPNYRLLDKVYESQVAKQHYHKKVLTVDGERAFVGSYNFGQKSALCDYEVGCVVQSPEITQKIDSGLDEDKGNSRELEVGAEWRGFNKFLGFLARSVLGNLAG